MTSGTKHAPRVRTVFHEKMDVRGPHSPTGSIRRLYRIERGLNMKAHVNAIVGALVLLLTVAVLAAPVAAAERLPMGDICEKN